MNFHNKLNEKLEAYAAGCMTAGQVYFICITAKLFHETDTEFYSHG
jgi:hypothetical protein